MAVIFGIECAAGWLSVAPLDAQALVRGALRGTLALGLFVLAAVGEEVMFRGYLQVNLGEGLGTLTAIAFSSLLFAFLHGLNPNVTWLALLNIALAGAVMGYGRATSGNLWLPMGYHLAWNWVQGALLALPVSGMRYGGMLAVTDTGAALLFTGGAFGPEAGLVGTAILLSGFPVLWWWHRPSR